MKIKMITYALTAVLISSMFSGCGSSGDKENTLNIWTKYSGKDMTVVKQLAEEWAKQKGCKVKVSESKDELDSYITAEENGRAPDLVIGLSGGELLGYAKASTVAKVPEDIIDKSKYLEQAVTAGTANGVLWGQPLAVESYALYYNKDLVKDVPKSWDELIQNGKEKGFKWEFSDMNIKNAFDKECEKNSALKKLYDPKIMTSSDTGDIPEQLFLNKKIAFLVTGAWMITRAKEAKLNFDVVPIPSTDANTTLAFTQYKYNFVSASTKKQALAWDFLKYSSEKLPKALFEEEGAIPATKELADSAEINKDPAVSQFVQLSKITN